MAAAKVGSSVGSGGDASIEALCACTEGEYRQMVASLSWLAKSGLGGALSEPGGPYRSGRDLGRRGKSVDKTALDVLGGKPVRGLGSGAILEDGDRGEESGPCLQAVVGNKASEPLEGGHEVALQPLVEDVVPVLGHS